MVFAGDGKSEMGENGLALGVGLTSSPMPNDLTLMTSRKIYK